MVLLILNVLRTTMKFYRVRYWRAILFFLAIETSPYPSCLSIPSEEQTNFNIIKMKKRKRDLFLFGEIYFLTTCFVHFNDASLEHFWGDNKKDFYTVFLDRGTRGATIADHANSTHTGCLSHCTIEEARLSANQRTSKEGIQKGIERYTDRCQIA